MTETAEPKAPRAARVRVDVTTIGSVASAAPAPPSADLLERLHDSALDAIIQRQDHLKAALEQHPEIREEARSNPEIVRLILAYVIDELDAQFGAVVDRLRAEYGGAEPYVAKRSARDRQRLADDVLALFNGRNASEVARRLGLSRATIYRVLKQHGRAR